MKLREKPMREGEWVGDGQIVPWISTMTLLMTACLRRATMKVALRRSKPSRYALIPYYTRFFILHFIAGMSIPQTTPTVCSPTSYPDHPRTRAPRKEVDKQAALHIIPDCCAMGWLLLLCLNSVGLRGINRVFLIENDKIIWQD
jgi:hypothetical protein